MKILFLSNAASIHTVRWVNALAERGHEVHLVFKADDSNKNNRINKLVIQHKLKFSGSVGYYFNAIELNKIAKSIKPDVVNAHYASGYGTLVRMARLKPLILSVWGSDVYDFPYQSKIKMKIIKKNLEYADVIASTSNIMAERTKKLLNNEKKDIKITHFGVDLNKFQTLSKNKLKDSSKIVIGNVKTLSSIYGIEYIVEAVALLCEQIKNSGNEDILKKLEVRIYGDGCDRDKLNNLIKELKLEKYVFLMGMIPNDEVPLALAQMDIFCATSNRESFGVSLIEAMAMELPVVSSDADGFVEVNINNETGLIVEKRNSIQISEALFTLIKDEKLRKAMGKCGRERVSKLYDWEKNVSTMTQIYKSLIV